MDTTGKPVAFGSVNFELNVDATIVASPFGIIPGNNIPVNFQLDANGNILPNAPAAAAQIYSNEELLPQNEVGLGTYYLVTVYDSHGARLSTPMWWIFPNPTGVTVDISTMTPYFAGGNVIFYPRIPIQQITSAVQVTIDGSGSVPATGAWGQISIPYACQITGWVLSADVAGSAVVDVLRSSYAGFPSTVSLVGAGTPPTLSAAQIAEGVPPSWANVLLQAGDELQIPLTSVATCTRLNLTLNLKIA